MASSSMKCVVFCIDGAHLVLALEIIAGCEAQRVEVSVFEHCCVAAVDEK